MKKLKFMARELKKDLQVYRLALKDTRTPKAAKLLLAFAVWYAVFPFDIIPDFVPILGHLDDAVIVPAVIRIALKMIPDDVIDEYRTRVSLEEGSVRPRRVARHRRGAAARRRRRS